MYKKMTMVLLAFLILLTPFHTAFAAPVYKDVPDPYKFKVEFDYLVKQGILTADPAVDFGVDKEITRIEAVGILIQALKLDTTDRPAPVFTDVKADDPNFPLIATIVDEKIMVGNGKGQFNPYEKLTRAQMATVLVKAFKLSGKTTTLFKDVSPSSAAYGAIQILIANKITAGYNDYTFKPYTYLTKSHFAVFIARILNPAFRADPKPPAPAPAPTPVPPASCEKPSKTASYKVNVSVTNMWKNPNKTRTVDKPSLSKPVDMKKWINGMTLNEKKWLVEKTDTQAVFGEEVSLLTAGSNWLEIAANDQYVPYQKEGYPGWVPKSHIAKVTKDYSDCGIAIVTAKLAPLYNTNDQKQFMEISYSTILPVIKSDNKWYHVQTPANGIKLLRKVDAKSYKNYKSVPKPSQANIVNEAKRFLDLPYLWAGTSAYGFDCSGIIYAVYKNFGITIPRDSFYQATKGTAVAKKDLQPGDLVFFAYNGGRGKVYHVGLYIGSGKMLHAPNASSKVRIEALNSGVYLKNYSGARRYLK